MARLLRGTPWRPQIRWWAACRPTRVWMESRPTRGHLRAWPRLVKALPTARFGTMRDGTLRELEALDLRPQVRIVSVQRVDPRLGAASSSPSLISIVCRRARNLRCTCQEFAEHRSAPANICSRLRPGWMHLHKLRVGANMHCSRHSITLCAVSLFEDRCMSEIIYKVVSMTVAGPTRRTAPTPRSSPLARWLVRPQS